MAINIINFGSLNIDYVYTVDHIVTPGETIASTNMEIFAGGKGLNQSVALARAGVFVKHAGVIGKEGIILIDFLNDCGIDVSCVRQQSKVPTGHAIIQVDRNGQNSIVLYKGANHILTPEFIDSIIENEKEPCIILLQNETNFVERIINSAKKKQHIVAFNPSPYDESLTNINFNNVDMLILNEIEAEQMCGFNDPDKITEYFTKIYPQMTVVLTLGEKGSLLLTKNKIYRHGIYKTQVEDTTAAGDTFTGYFLSGYLSDMQPYEILRYAAVAAGLTVSKKGAATSIPTADEVHHIVSGLDSSN